MSPRITRRWQFLCALILAFEILKCLRLGKLDSAGLHGARCGLPSWASRHGSCLLFWILFKTDNETKPEKPKTKNKREKTSWKWKKKQQHKIGKNETPTRSALLRRTSGSKFYPLPVSQRHVMNNETWITRNLSPRIHTHGAATGRTQRKN